MRDVAYADEASTRAELTRVFDVCLECRQCVDLCPTFSSLFDLIDTRRRTGADAEAGDLTPAQQDRIVDGCFQCKRCLVDCPFAPPASPESPESTEQQVVDMPATMLRAMAMRFANGHLERRDRLAARLLGRIDTLGPLGCRLHGVFNRVLASRPGSPDRRIVGRLTGLTSRRPIPPFADQRFSTWFQRRPRIRLGRRLGAVTVFPTCLVEYQSPEIGEDLVKVYERNGFECSTSAAGCCGAPSLHAGDLDRFTKIAERNVRALAAEVRAGTEIVVPQPSCGWVLRHDYVDHVGPALRDDAELVAGHTRDAAEFLVEIDQGDHTVLDTDFAGLAPTTITYHSPAQLLAEHIGYRGRDLMRLTAARVRLVQQSSGMGSPWGYRSSHDAAAIELGDRLGREFADRRADVLAGDCQLANAVIADRTSQRVDHPLRVLARAYGMPEEPHVD